MIPQLETARLILRPLELADAEQVQEIFPHWEIVQFLSRVPWPYPDDGAFTHYRDVTIPAMERGDEWSWSIRLKTASGEVIGNIALIRGTDNNRGFWLGRPWQGRGLMTEATEAVTDYWFNTLGFTVLRVPKAVANAPSRRISAKNGMRVVAVEERDYVGGRLMAEIWEITAEEWRNRK